jgi:HSP20 family protein
MANIVRRDGGEAGRGQTIQRGGGVPSANPLRMMRDLLGFDPFVEMSPMLQQFAEPGTFVPQFEVRETPDAFVFKADLPGVDEEDLEISITGNRLTVSGRREAEDQQQTDRYFAVERMYGTFTRSFTLPEGIDPDRVEADLSDGVLTLKIPKQPQNQPKKISLKGAVGKVVEKVKDAVKGGEDKGGAKA